eukprot:c22890_g1_i1 orf=290-1264(+)
MASGSGQTVCVTGASGFIGSWIVRFLLQQEYSVRGTVQDIGDERETKHLEALGGAKDRLRLFQADLLDYDALAVAIGNSDGVFHVACPCILEILEDPKRIVIDPAVEGTLNVLKASHIAKVKRVVMTSSISAMVPNPKLPEGTVVDENSWADIDFCKENGVWYPLAKTLAEKAAWNFAAQTGLDIVCINPGCALGPMLQPKLNTSSAILLSVIKGVPDALENTWLGCVHVKDVAKAHILLYETPQAKGRYLCTESINRFSDFAEQVARLFPQYNVYRFDKPTHLGLVTCKSPSKKLMALGVVFAPAEVAICDAAASLKEKGYLE